jgi:hypothetical protein
MPLYHPFVNIEASFAHFERPWHTLEGEGAAITNPETQIICDYAWPSHSQLLLPPFVIFEVETDVLRELQINPTITGMTLIRPRKHPSDLTRSFKTEASNSHRFTEGLT